MSGKVYLVGAGPGDPELLTVKAARILGEADVVLHDDLVSAAIVKLVAPGALVSNVGKRCGKKQVTQGQIHAAMVSYARRGLTVVRLKGGDPLIFGRAGEEIDALESAGIDFEIVPGVTAACSAAAAAGISLTHRRGASTLVFLSGHPSADKPQNDWPNLGGGGAGSPAATVVVYMPGSDYTKLGNDLCAAGVKRDSPCLLVSGASSSAPQNHRTSLNRLSDAPALASPKILIVGEVARQHHARRAARGAANPEIAKSQHKNPLSLHKQADRENRTPVLAPQVVRSEQDLNKYVKFSHHPSPQPSPPIGGEGGLRSGTGEEAKLVGLRSKTLLE